MHLIKNENLISPNSPSALKSQFAKLLRPEKSMTADTRRRSNDLRSGEQVSVSELAGQFKRAASARFTSTNPTPSTPFHQNLDIGLRQSPGIEIVEDGGY